MSLSGFGQASYRRSQARRSVSCLVSRELPVHTASRNCGELKGRPFVARLTSKGIRMAYFQCALCEISVPVSAAVWCCTKCGGHLKVEGAGLLRRSDIDISRRSLWRYQTALAYQGAMQVSLGEGWTPLVEGRWQDMAVSWKCEFISVSGSFKDRGVAVMLNHLLANGIRKVAEDSSGNGGAAVATYAAAADMACRVYVPASTSPGKVTQMAAAGAEVIRIPGSRQAVADAAMKDESGYFYGSHNWHPAFVDGIKTVGYEIWEQLGFQVPDAIIAPVGGGSNLLGCFEAFSGLRKSGETNRLPRLYGAQSTSCAPLAQAFARGADTYAEVETSPSIAEGIAVSRPVRSRELLAAVRESGGAVMAVTEDGIARAHALLARRGLYVEPTSAAAAALLDQLVERGDVQAHERVVVILTGSGLKAGELIARMRGSSQPTA
jgi:threonine synthase